MSTTQRIATNVRTVARHRGLTMKALAQGMGYKNVQVLFTRLSGGTRLSVDELDALAGLLGVTAADLLGNPSDLLTLKSGWTTAWAGQDPLFDPEHIDLIAEEEADEIVRAA